MKKAIPWITALSALSLVLSWGVMGVRILNHDYDFLVEVHVALVSFLLLIGCLLYYRFSRWKCPHCGRIRTAGGEYCSYCGKKINDTVLR